MKTYKRLAHLLAQIKASNRITRRADIAESAIWHIQENILPQGSGFDHGTTLDIENSAVNKFIFHSSYHHMTDGNYTHWTEFIVTVTPSFLTEYTIDFSGDVNDEDDAYFGDVFAAAMDTEDEED